VEVTKNINAVKTISQEDKHTVYKVINVINYETLLLDGSQIRLVAIIPVIRMRNSNAYYGQTLSLHFGHI
jgi:hypothetical protein